MLYYWLTVIVVADSHTPYCVNNNNIYACHLTREHASTHTYIYSDASLHCTRIVSQQPLLQSKYKVIIQPTNKSSNDDTVIDYITDRQKSSSRLPI